MKKEVKCSECLIENEDTSLSQRDMEYRGNLGMIETEFTNGMKTKGQYGLYQCENCKKVIVA
jgi:hypothetical protein